MTYRRSLVCAVEGCPEDPFFEIEDPYGVGAREFIDSCVNHVGSLLPMHSESVHEGDQRWIVRLFPAPPSPRRTAS